MTITITASYNIYLQPNIRRCLVTSTANCASDSIDSPFRKVYKTLIHEIPTMSNHVIMFSKNKDFPFMDSYEIKVNRPVFYIEESSSYFEVAGSYIDETVLESSFQNIPNDLKDYEPDPKADPVYDDYENLTRLNFE